MGKIIFGLFFFGIIAGVVFLFVKQNRKARTNFAINLGLSLAEYGEGKRLIKQLEEFYLFREASVSQEFNNILVGKIDDTDVKIFDYYVNKGGKVHGHPYFQGQIVFLFESKGLNFPKFQLRAKEGGLQKEIEIPKIPFLSHDEIKDVDPLLLFQDQQNYPRPYSKFTSKYLLRGPDHSSIRSLFNEETLKYFEKQKPRMSVEAVGNKLICYKYDSRPEPSELAGLYKKGLEIFNLLKSRL
jgi:hypothetical protein